MPDEMTEQEQFEAALAVATWSPVDGFDGIEAADLGHQMAARKVATTAPVLGFSRGDWSGISDGDQDLASILRQLA